MNAWRYITATETTVQPMLRKSLLLNCVEPLVRSHHSRQKVRWPVDLDGLFRLGDNQVEREAFCGLVFEFVSPVQLGEHCRDVSLQS